MGIASLADLEAAAKADRIKKAKGLGAALQTKILQNLAIARSGEGLLPHPSCLHTAAGAKATLERTRPELKNVTIAGDFRRGCELVANLALVAAKPGIGKKGLGNPLVIRVSEVYIVNRKRFGAALLQATGSPEHLNSFGPSRRRKECGLP